MKSPRGKVFWREGKACMAHSALASSSGGLRLPASCAVASTIGRWACSGKGIEGVWKGRSERSVQQARPRPRALHTLCRKAGAGRRALRQALRQGAEAGAEAGAGQRWTTLGSRWTTLGSRWKGAGAARRWTTVRRRCARLRHEGAGETLGLRGRAAPMQSRRLRPAARSVQNASEGPLQLAAATRSSPPVERPRWRQAGAPRGPSPAHGPGRDRGPLITRTYNLMAQPWRVSLRRSHAAGQELPCFRQSYQVKAAAAVEGTEIPWLTTDCVARPATGGEARADMPPASSRNRDAACSLSCCYLRLLPPRFCPSGPTS